MKLETLGWHLKLAYAHSTITRSICIRFPFPWQPPSCSLHYPERSPKFPQPVFAVFEGLLWEGKTDETQTSTSYMCLSVFKMTFGCPHWKNSAIVTDTWNLLKAPTKREIQHHPTRLTDSLLPFYHLFSLLWDNGTEDSHSSIQQMLSVLSIPHENQLSFHNHSN